MKSRPLVIVGDSAFAEIACEYFDADTEYDVVAFAVERAYLRKTALMGRPVLAFEDLPQHLDPRRHSVFVAVVYTQLNRLRARLLQAALLMGYAPASYISPRASVWRNVQFGEHCFVFEDNTVQPFVRVGRNVVLWSGNHIGHHSVVEDDCFVSSHVVVSGFCQVGARSFLGVNATVANNVRIGCDNWLGPNTVLMQDSPDGALYRGEASQTSRVSAPRFFKVGG